MHHTTHTRLAAWALVASCALCASACSAEHTVTVTAAQMQAHVAEKFPQEVKVPRLGIIRAHSPTVRTDGVSERIEIGFNVDLDHPKKELKRINVALSTKIDYDAATTTFVAVEPRVLRLETSDGEKLGFLADRALNAWVVRQWPRLPVYRLEGRDELKPKLAKALLKSVKVQDNGVACRLGW